MFIFVRIFWWLFFHSLCCFLFLLRWWHILPKFWRSLWARQNFFLFLPFFLESSGEFFSLSSVLLRLTWWDMLLCCVSQHLKQVFLDLKYFKSFPYLVQLGNVFCDLNNVFLVSIFMITSYLTKRWLVWQYE